MQEIHGFRPDGTEFHSQDEPPPEIAEIIEVQAAADGQWFRNHPGTTEFERDPRPGEAWPIEVAPGSRIRVLLLSGGLRARLVLPPTGINN